MTSPYFVADAANVTVLRSVASTAFGKYDLQVPEGIDLEDVHDFAAPGNELGYVAGLSGERVGGMMRRFVRADVSVTAADESDPSWVPDSNVDQVLREAEQRVSGDFFLESDITLAGLGPWTPFVDFQVGDTANVEIWGRVVQLPVTRIEPVVSDHSVVDFRVHVGGQLVSDEDARLAENEIIRRALVEDRRDLAGLKSQVSKAVESAESAKSTADSALEAAGDTRAYVDDQLADVRSSIADSGVYLENVKAYVAEGRQHAESAAAMAQQAGEMATQAEQIYANMDPLRDDVESIHAEVSRLGLLAAGHAQQAAEEAALGKTYVESAKAYAQQALEQAQAGEQHVADAGVQATAAQEYASRAQKLVGDAQAVLDGTNADAQAAKKALEDAGKLLNDVDGKGTSLPEALAQVVTMHQEVLETHTDILDAHRDVLEKHGQAIRWAAMAAARAAVAAQSASQAAQDALRASAEAARAADDAATAAGHANRAAEENAAAIVTLGQADEKLKEADRKLQAQIDETRKAGELLAQAVKILAAGVAANSAASQSALLAADENRKANAATNLAVETLTEVQKETSRQATTAEKVAQDAKAASDAATKAVNAQKATVNDTNDLARLTHFRRTRVFIYERASDSQSETGVKLPWDDRTTALTFDVDSSGAIFKWDGAWEGYIKVTAMSASSRLGINVFDVLGFTTGKFELWDKISSEWIERYVIEIFPLWPDKATKNRFYQRGLTGLK
ncbi:hypothetical protein EJK80_06035 [Corynebacterium phoceense]|uniref:Uncharacterized protein n=1 Tax=Corynebacterium phoceense TaxID=1686286 RepID=A0A540R745_9CORY|nr:hypothetical protein [Corynebacterium phoceense]TQE43565.1 hypothetical protein EJK80_06035 [Corynebacterium phoceense]